LTVPSCKPKNKKSSKNGSSFRRYASRFLVLRQGFRHLNLFHHLDPKIRCALKRKKPLVAVKTTLSVNGPPSPVERIKTRSRNKFGMTADGFSERARCCHSDKAPGRNLNALASRFFSANGEPLNGQPVPLLFPTTNPLTPTTFPKAQIPKQVRDDN